jgi:hypothetical protein
MVKGAVVGLMVVISCYAAYAEDEHLGKDDFLTSSISAVFDKVGQYTSGEKRLLGPQDEGMRQGAGYAEDALGRKLNEGVTITGSLTPAKDKVP